MGQRASLNELPAKSTFRHYEGSLPDCRASSPNLHIGYEKAAKVTFTAYQQDISLHEAAFNLGFSLRSSSIHGNARWQEVSERATKGWCPHVANPVVVVAVLAWSAGCFHRPALTKSGNHQSASVRKEVRSKYRRVVYINSTSWQANRRSDNMPRRVSRDHHSRDVEDGPSCTKRAGAAPIDSLVP
jgi:hypothetical protein